MPKFTVELDAETQTTWKKWVEITAEDQDQADEIADEMAASAEADFDPFDGAWTVESDTDMTGAVLGYAEPNEETGGEPIVINL